MVFGSRMHWVHSSGDDPVLDALRLLPPATLSLVGDTGDYTAAALVAAVENERTWLKEMGGTRYALLADNGPAWVIADLALLENRVLQVPLPAYFAPAQIQHVLKDAGIDRVLTDQPDRLAQVLPDLKVIGQSRTSGLTLLSCPPLQGASAAPTGTIKVTYTSGSTGTPKGVCLGLDGPLTVARTLAAQSSNLGVKRHLCLLPLPTLLENLAGVYAPLIAGATCLVPSLKTVGMSYGGVDAPRLLATIAAQQPNSLILVPELLKLLVVAAEQGWRAPPTLKFIAVGGAAVPPDLLVRAHAVGLPAYEGYGLTECTSVVSLNLPGASRIGSAGRPLPHAHVRIDAEGQIHVRGSLLLGYLGDPQATPDEVATGDLGELDAEGYLHIRGRLSNVLITSMGRNIAPEWIETLLLEHPAIGQVVLTGEGRPFVVAVVSPAGPGVPDHLIDHAIEKTNSGLPDYAAVRGWVRADNPFAFAEGLLTANGRPRRTAIMGRYRERIAALYADATVASPTSAVA
jgi:long-chain acyl-CoA synthetase